jgi:hypothetical protein
VVLLFAPNSVLYPVCFLVVTALGVVRARAWWRWAQSGRRTRQWRESVAWDLSAGSVATLGVVVGCVAAEEEWRERE